MTCVRRFTCDDLFTSIMWRPRLFHRNCKLLNERNKNNMSCTHLDFDLHQISHGQASLCRNALPCLSMLAIASLVAVPSASQCDQFGQSQTAMKGVSCPQYNLPFYLQ